MGMLDGKVALITGGASGIGRAAALRFAAEGARVAIGDVQDAAVVEEIGADRAFALRTDVTDEAQVAALVQETVSRFGKVDIGLFCAGVGAFAPVHALESAVFERVLRLNVLGVFAALKHTAVRMIAQGTGGSLLAIASLNARQPAEGLAAYCTSKAAVAMLMANAALELGRYGIRANAIGPGLVETPLSAPLWQNAAIRDAFIAETPMGRYAQPEEIAALAAYIASDAASFISGQTIYIDGGQSLKKYPELFRALGP
jgi:NAD(P)-dependent dehydrogenase (short-subunit alcohol dehydrogenase family)